MYLDTGTLIAALIALVSQFIMMVVLFRSSYFWEQKYRDVVRLLKQERAARNRARIKEENMSRVKLGTRLTWHQVG